MASAEGWIELTGNCSQRCVPLTGAWRNAAISAAQVASRSGSATFQVVSLSSGTNVAASMPAAPRITATNWRKANSYSEQVVVLARQGSGGGADHHDPDGGGDHGRGKQELVDLAGPRHQALPAADCARRANSSPRCA